MNIKFQEIKKILSELNKFSEEEINAKIEKMYLYMKGILEWNEKVNLTNIINEEDFIQNHYIDSISPIILEEFLSSRNVIDIGTGGGFPGVPLAIIFDDKKFTLVDSLNKRISIINQLCREIGINNVKAIHGRAEDLAREKMLRESFDIALSRAVSNLPVLIELVLPFVKAEGYFLAHKGPKGVEEIKAAEKALKECSGEYKGFVEDIYQKNVEHIIIKIKKSDSISDKYPRRAGIPNKKPLI